MNFFVIYVPPRPRQSMHRDDNAAVIGFNPKNYNNKIL